MSDWYKTFEDKKSKVKSLPSNRQKKKEIQKFLNEIKPIQKKNELLQELSSKFGFEMGNLCKPIDLELERDIKKLREEATQKKKDIETNLRLKYYGYE